MKKTKVCGLPLDICSDIFLRCSAESLIRFRAVCKEWRAAIDEPCFVKTYTEQQQQLPSTTILIRNSTGHPFYPLYSVDLQTLEFTDGLQSIPAAPLNITRDGLSRLPRIPAAACNGLTLIPPPSGEESNLEILNILTQERLHLPRLDSSVGRWSATGLGYDAATDDYKAVVIVRQESKPPVYHTNVYSLRSDEWRKIANFPCVDRYIATHVGAFHGGALHWMTFKGIIALDMKTETYRQLDLPPLRQNPYGTTDLSDRSFSIHVLSGCLMVSDEATNDGDEKHYDLWEMKENGTWVNLITSTRDYTSAIEFYMTPVVYMKNKMQIFLQDGYDVLYLFDVASNSKKIVSIHGLFDEKLDTQAFCGSIFRLHDNCGRRVINGGGSFSKEGPIIKMADIDTELIFCLRDDGLTFYSHYDCFFLDSNCCYSSTEEEEEEEEEDMDED